jgi:serine/threonine protein kinase/tetratricopeptide (TPR) repeat protein
VIETVISHYRILKRLGEGGMGEVFLAEDLRLRRLVALKTLRPDAAGKAEARARLFQEARAASALNHPNLAVIYEVDEAVTEQGSLALIALEYVDGESIVEHVRRTAPGLEKIVDLVRQVADGLGSAHRRGIVHRDIKPSNVMVTAEGRVKVLDFGLAKMQPFGGDDAALTWTRDPASHTLEGRVIGTVAYMSPEQALGREVDPRADVFSLGVVLYELIAGRQPFTGENAVAVFDAILHHEPPPLAAFGADSRIAAVERVVRKMIAKDRDARHLTLAEACSELGAALAGLAPVSPERPAVSGPPTLVVLSFRNITLNNEDAWLGIGIAESLIADLRASGHVRVLARDRVQAALRRLNLTEDAIEEPAALGVARELGARWVVSGAFQRSADVVRVTTNLFDSDSGQTRSTSKLDGRVSEMFDLQDRIADHLQRCLAPNLIPKHTPGADTQVVAAFEALSKGLLNQRLQTHEGVERAALFFERAVALDPRYARAHVELSAAYSSKADYLAMPETRARAIQSLRRAIEIDPAYTRAWRDLGLDLVVSGAVDEGVETVRRALALSSDDPATLAAMGRALFIGKGDFEGAAAHYEKALALNPKGGWYWLQLSHCSALAGALRRAREAAEQAIALQEAFVSGHVTISILGAYMRLGHIEALEGHDERAVKRFQQEFAFMARVEHGLRNRIQVELHTRLAGAQLRLGAAAEAASSLTLALDSFETRVRLGADEPFTRYYAACAYALQGNRETAMACLERAAVSRRDYTIARARIEPELASLKDDPAFRQLIG